MILFILWDNSRPVTLNDKNSNRRNKSGLKSVLLHWRRLERTGKQRFTSTSARRYSGEPQNSLSRQSAHETASQSEIKQNSVDSSYDSQQNIIILRETLTSRLRCFSGGLGGSECVGVAGVGWKGWMARVGLGWVEGLGLAWDLIPCNSIHCS